VPPLAMPIVVTSSSYIWSAIAGISRSPMQERRGPRTVVHIVGSRALESFFPHTAGSSTRIGVRLVVIGAPTVRLAEIVGTGCMAIAAAAAAAITMRLCGRAAASARPPPAVRARHFPGFSSKKGGVGSPCQRAEWWGLCCLRP
jgi:hypothetical protein